MRLPYQTDLAGVDVAMLGVPFDSGTRIGRARGSGRARSGAVVADPSLLVLPEDLAVRELTIVDAGDVDAPPVGIEPAYAAIEAAVDRILDAGATPLSSAAIIRFRCRACAPSRACTVRSRSCSSTRTSTPGAITSAASTSTVAVPPRDRESDHRAAQYVQVGIRGPMYGEDEDFTYQREQGSPRSTSAW
jgi:arginase family enzyme